MLKLRGGRASLFPNVPTLTSSDQWTTPDAPAPNLMCMPKITTSDTASPFPYSGQRRVMHHNEDILGIGDDDQLLLPRS